MDETAPSSGIRHRVRAIAFITREAWSASRPATLFSLLELASSAARGLTPALYGAIVAGVVAHSASRALSAAGAVGVVSGMLFIAGLWGSRYRVGLMQALADRFEGRTARLMASLPTTSHHEDPASLDTVQALRDRGGAVGAAYNFLANALNGLASPIAVLIVAVAADWRLAFVALAGVPQILITGHASRIMKTAEDAGAEPSRRVEGLMALTADRSGASEVRVFGARDFLRRRIHSATEEWMTPEVAATKKTSLLVLGTSLLYFAVAAGVLAWMARDALAGSVSVAVMTVALTSLQSLQSAISSIRWSLTSLTSSFRNIDRYLWLEDHVKAELAAHSGTARPPERLTEGIRLVDVTFTRPGASEPVFRNLSLDLPAGAIVALVGENGAGKTTLVDLLLGLHDLDGGRIEVDGVPLTALDLADWRTRCAGAFQDHVRLEVSAQEAIGVGDLPRKDSAAAVRAALEDAAATDVLQALPRGLETQLGPDWPDGTGLSGGQWQRLAIARGMMRRTPLLRVLDEPTSALDAATEDALFQRYARAARETRRSGGITLLVTHRFSTVSAADLVVVLDHGEVVEQGTHRDLMRAGGRYAELYSLQARGYT